MASPVLILLNMRNTTVASSTSGESLISSLTLRRNQSVVLSSSRKTFVNLYFCRIGSLVRDDFPSRRFRYT